MNLEQALVSAIDKMAGRKNGIAVIAMAFLYAMGAPTWQVFGLGGLAIALQFALDGFEVYRTGQDLPERNGNLVLGRTTDGENK